MKLNCLVLLLIFLYSVICFDDIEEFKYICDKTELNKNVIMSPPTTQDLLLLGAAGANDKTQHQIAKALNEKSLTSAIETLKNITSISSNHKTLTISKSIFSKYTPIESFVTFANNYRTQIKKFKSMKDINDWSSKHSNNTIQELVKDEVNNYKLIILSSLNFTSKFKYAFNTKSTHKIIFHGRVYHTIIDIMYHKFKLLKFKYVKDEKYKAIELPLNDEKLIVNILLPDEKYNIDDFIKNITTQNLGKSGNNGKEEEDVELFGPRFKGGNSIEISDEIQNLGIKNAFTDGADFSNIDTMHGLQISKVFQNCIGNVSEEGAENETMKHLDPFKVSGFEMKINRPFIFMIRSRVRKNRFLGIAKISQLLS